MMKRSLVVLIGLVLLLWTMGESTRTIAAPIYNPDNGHYYEAIPGDIDWLTAKALADSYTYNGMQAHLATLTGQAENDWVWNSLGTNLSFYLLGGTDIAEEGVWKWVTGEPWAYTNWNLNEPNDYSNEDALEFWGNSLWNDASAYSKTSGFIVEYESILQVPALLDPDGSSSGSYHGENGTSSPVPEPGTIALISSGMILSLGWQRLSMKPGLGLSKYP